MFLVCLLYCLTCATLFQLAQCRPWLISSVELQACGTDPSPMAGPSECLSVCTPVSRAQELCHGDPSCTCSISPPAALSSCLECHISRRDGLESQWIMATSNARKSYSQLCSGVAPSVLHPNYSPSALSSLSSTPSDGNSTSSEDTTTLSRRESLQGDDYCIYGFPVIRWRFPEPFEFSPIIDDTNLFIVFFFILSVIVCVVQNRKTSS